ncbi:type II secretion system F family protein [Pelomonas sp. UHG3]|jgi:tight adherence protein C|uniref:Type II secretion system F family protein n=1 Tax=Roseateles hydrophilus TaxID=2975054 RepID=A0ACC6CFI2_9BURK|nr:type II secretion system F family protein [Pelomonas sp. UHG3]MCY4747089.1 type II secretion system F family protein [Pelomonas sp. UHG3]
MSGAEFTWMQWLPLACALGLGVAMALIAHSLMKAIDDVPAEDRSYRDSPPTAFRLLWWPIRWIAHYLGPRLRPAQRLRVQGRLRLAGLDYALAPEQFIAAQLLGAAISGLLTWWLLASFGRPAGPWPWVGAAFGFLFPAIWLRDLVQLRRRETLKTLPFMLDIITLCVEAGLNLTGAFAQAVAKGPAGPLRDEFSRVLRDVRAGRPRLDALRTLSDRMNEPSITNFVSALIQAERMGMNLGPILRAQAEQRRTERFARAEKLAMEAPVKLLFPLIAFIFPCTFVVLGFPIAMKFLHMGL